MFLQKKEASRKSCLKLDVCKQSPKIKGQLISEWLFDVLKKKKKKKSKGKIWWIPGLESRNGLKWKNKGPFKYQLRQIAPN